MGVLYIIKSLSFCFTLYVFITSGIIVRHSLALAIANFVLMICLISFLKKDEKKFTNIFLKEIKTPIAAQKQALSYINKKNNNLTTQQKELVELALKSANETFVAVDTYL